MNQNKEIKINIAEKKWLSVKPLSGDTGIKVQVITAYSGNYTPALVGCITESDNGEFTYTFIDEARQMRTKIKGKNSNVSLLHLNHLDTISVKLSDKSHLVASIIQVNGANVGAELFVCDDKNVASLIRYVINGDEVKAEITGLEVTIPKKEMLFGNDA